MLDLRSDGEIERSPSPFAGSAATVYLHRPLIDDQNMNEIGEAADMLERYLFIVDRRPEAFRDVFSAVADAEGTVLFHCFAGKDRTGLVAALLLELAGVPREHIAGDYGETDVHLAEKYALWIAEAESDKRAAFRAELQCPPERILGVLDHIDRGWGGVDGYLDAAGVPASSIERLATMLA